MTATCPLCGHIFDLKANCHDGCPMSSGCSLVRCDNCRYEFPDPGKSVSVRWLGKLLGKRLGAGGAS